MPDLRLVTTVKTLMTARQRELYATSTKFRHSVDDLMRNVLPLYLDGLERAAEDELKRDDEKTAALMAATTVSMGPVSEACLIGSHSWCLMYECACPHHARRRGK